MDYCNESNISTDLNLSAKLKTNINQLINKHGNSFVLKRENPLKTQPKEQKVEENVIFRLNNKKEIVSSKFHFIQLNIQF